MISFQGMRLRRTAATETFLRTDWSATALGSVDAWPAALKTVAQLCLNSEFPMTVMWGPDRVTLYNDGYLPIMGDKHPEGFGRPVAAIYPELVDDVLPTLQAVEQDGNTVFEKDRLLPLLHQGELREVYFTFSYSPIHDEEGRIGGVLAVATETTNEVLHRRRSATIRSITEELSQQRSLQPVAPAVRRALGGNADDFAARALVMVPTTGDPDAAWCEPESAQAAFLRSLEVTGHLCALREGRLQTSVTRLSERTFALNLVDPELLDGPAAVLLVQPGDRVRVDGRYLSLLEVIHKNMVGALYRILGERRAMAEVTRQLDEHQRLYGLLFEHSREGILLSDGDGQVVTTANPAACALLGYSEDEILRLGRTGVAVKGEDLDRAVAERAYAGTFVGELEMRKRDGGTMLADVSSTLFLDELTGADRTITFFRDAGPRRLAQERLASTARLESLGALTGGIAHDFNNLLNVIINGADDLVDRLPGEDGCRESAQMILTASVRAAELTRQLLAFSRQQPLEARTVDVGQTISELDQILGRTMGGAINVDVEVDRGTYARTDTALLSSAILNLCINARDAMPDGGTLRVSTQVMDVAQPLAAEIDMTPGDYVQISVSDSGFGIAPANVGRVLEPFYTTKPIGKGTGLGLSMVFGFVRQSGGGMRIRSTPGAGTRVELYLPLASAESAEMAGSAAEPARTTASRPGGQPRLLVVEDEGLLADMLSRILEGAGYQVTVCATGEQALEFLQTDGATDVMITDILLGSGMDGWTLADRAARGWPDMRVVTMSGFAPAVGSEIYGLRRSPTLHKPFRPREILKLVNEQLAAAQPG